MPNLAKMVASKKMITVTPPRAETAHVGFARVGQTFVDTLQKGVDHAGGGFDEGPAHHDARTR